MPVPLPLLRLPPLPVSDVRLPPIPSKANTFTVDARIDHTIGGLRAVLERELTARALNVVNVAVAGLA